MQILHYSDDHNYMFSVLLFTALSVRRFFKSCFLCADDKISSRSFALVVRLLYINFFIHYQSVIHFLSTFFGKNFWRKTSHSFESYYVWESHVICISSLNGAKLVSQLTQITNKCQHKWQSICKQSKLNLNFHSIVR